MPYDVIGARIVLDDPAIKRLGEATARDMVESAAQIIVADAKGSFTGGGGEYGEPAKGNEYPKGVNGDIVHVASAPGQPPAVDTGRLRASLDMVMMPGEPRALIGTPVDYAPFLEFGTSRMKPRPLWRTVIYRYHGNNNLAYKAARHLKARGRLR